MAAAMDRWLRGEPTKIVDSPWSASKPHCTAGIPKESEVVICGGGARECVCSDWFDHNATAASFDPRQRPRVEVCVDPLTGQAMGLSSLNGNRTEVLGPPLPAGCALHYANVSNGAQGVVLVSRHLTCDTDAAEARRRRGSTERTSTKVQVVRFSVAGNASVVDCTDSSGAAARDSGSSGAAGLRRGDEHEQGCSPVVRGCCVRPVGE
jgi:hypothetical protein